MTVLRLRAEAVNDRQLFSRIIVGAVFVKCSRRGDTVEVTSLIRI